MLRDSFCGFFKPLTNRCSLTPRQKKGAQTLESTCCLLLLLLKSTVEYKVYVPSIYLVRVYNTGISYTMRPVVRLVLSISSATVAQSYWLPSPKARAFFSRCASLLRVALGLDVDLDAAGAASFGFHDQACLLTSSKSEVACARNHGAL